jgi:hypothetical protein
MHNFFAKVLCTAFWRKNIGAKIIGAKGKRKMLMKLTPSFQY